MIVTVAFVSSVTLIGNVAEGDGFVLSGVLGGCCKAKKPTIPRIIIKANIPAIIFWFLIFNHSPFTYLVLMVGLSSLIGYKASEKNNQNMQIAKLSIPSNLGLILEKPLNNQLSIFEGTIVLDIFKNCATNISKKHSRCC